MLLHGMLWKGFELQINYYNNQIILKLDLKAYIKEIILNGCEDIDIALHHSVLELLDENSQAAFKNALNHTIHDQFSLGLSIKLINSENAFMFMIKHNEEITLFSVCIDDKMVSLFDEIIKINNDQLKSIRDLYKKISKMNDEYGFLEEIMILNNTLINTRRELFQKNKQLSQLNDQLKILNETDFLTKIFNRRRFFNDIEMISNNQKYLLIMMDINNFKMINDLYGHIEGDKLLISFASELKDFVKKYQGFAYRLGGDEFACLIPKNTSINLKQKFDEINQKIMKYDSHISIAYGYKEIDHSMIQSTEKIESTISLADEMMYKMKKRFHQSNHS